MALSADNPFSELISGQKNEMINPFQDLIDEHRKQKLDPNILKRIPHALGEIGSDIWSGIKATPKSAVNAWGAIPEVVESAERQFPGAYQQITEDPARAGKNIVGGLAK